VALGLKQKTKSPWHNIEAKYPIGEKVSGEVVNITPYGAFVKLEEGIEGLVHVSEMSWTKRINHPSEVVSAGEEVEVVVLAIDKAKQEISLGMKQTEVNPWTLVKEKYPPGSEIEGVVQNLANYGAFVEIEEGIDGLLHVSDMSWTQKVNHPSEALEKGQKVTCQVLSVDQDKKRVALGLKQLEEDPWQRHIPETYVAGAVVRGRVTKVTNFGVFVELEPGLEGLLHVSELADHKVDNPEDVVARGEEIDVKVLRVDTEERKIGLSLKRVQWAEEEEETADEPSRAGPRLGGIEPAEAPAEGGGEGRTTLFGAPLPAVGEQAGEAPAEGEEAEAAADEKPTETEHAETPEAEGRGDETKTTAADQEAPLPDGEEAEKKTPSPEAEDPETGGGMDREEQPETDAAERKDEQDASPGGRDTGEAAKPEKQEHADDEAKDS